MWGGRGKSRYPISFELAGLSLIGCRDRPFSPQPLTFFTCMHGLVVYCAHCPLFLVRLDTLCNLPVTSHSPITACALQYTFGEHPTRTRRIPRPKAPARHRPRYEGCDGKRINSGYWRREEAHYKQVRSWPPGRAKGGNLKVGKMKGRSKM